MKSPNAYKSASQAASALSNAAATKGANYVAGVQHPGVDWEGAATSEAAQNAMKSGLMTALNEGRVAAGMARAGNAKWRANAAAKGGASWGPQLQKAATTTYQAGMNTVLNDFQGARSAYEKANTMGGFAGREAGGAAWRAYLHAQAEARKASGGR